MGQIVGGTLLIYLLSKLIEWAIIKRVMNNPTVGGFGAIGIAYLLAAVIYGFGAANGGPWTPAGFLLYIPGAAIVAIIRMAIRATRSNDFEDAA